jgi:hypothetical protein
MNDLQLYINDQLVDLSDDSPIALTFQINNLAEVKNQQGNTSNQFKLPLTQNNRRILGFPDDVAFCTKLPYTKYQAKIIQDGLEIIPYGIGELSSVDNDTANITVLSGNVDFFDAIDGKLYDMGDSESVWTKKGKELLWQQYDHKWSVENVALSQTKTEGWIWPMVDYGKISAADYSTPIDVRYQRPGFFIKTAIDLLIKSTGYKAKGSLFDDPLCPLLICQFANDTFEHGTDHQKHPNGSIQVQTGQNLTFRHPNVNNPLGSVPFGLVYYDPDRFYLPQQNSYTSPQIINVAASFTFSLAFYSTNSHRNAYGSKVDIQLRRFNAGDPNGTVLEHKLFEYAARGDADTIRAKNQTISCETLLQPGQSLKVTYEFSGYTGGMLTLDAGATFSVNSKNEAVQFGQMVQCERIFPDISQKDLLKDTLQRFGIICQTDKATKTISFNSFRDIVDNIPIAKNWSKKCVDHGKTINFQLGGYAQVNTMKYKEDDAVLPKSFADSAINVTDDTLQASADLFESQFGPTLNRPYISWTIGTIKMIEAESEDGDFSISVSPRILVDKKLDLRDHNQTVTFTDYNGNNVVLNDIISIPYFYKPDGQYNLCFKDMPGSIANKPLPGLKTKYYPELEKILQQTKKVVRYFLLTPRDILELDFLIPVYLEQDSAYYYINKIDAWRKGQPVKVELVKIG